MTLLVPKFFAPIFFLGNSNWPLMRSFPQIKAAKDTALLHKTKSKLATKLAVPGPRAF
jgi:hypothetical protein